MTIKSIKNRIDALAPEEEYTSDPRRMTDKQLITRIIQDRYGRPPTAWELTREGSDRLIDMLMKERDG